jgi:hypothetical protein
MSAYGGQRVGQQSGGYSAYRPGNAQSRQQPSFGTAYNPQAGGQFSQPGQGGTQQGYRGTAQPQQPPPFQFSATDFMGNQFNNPGALAAQQGAMAQALNQQRSQQIGNMFTQGTPMGSLNPAAAYGQGQEMIRGGFQNPFATAMPSSGFQTPSRQASPSGGQAPGGPAMANNLNALINQHGMRSPQANDYVRRNGIFF